MAPTTRAGSSFPSNENPMGPSGESSLPAGFDTTNIEDIEAAASGLDPDSTQRPLTLLLRRGRARSATPPAPRKSRRVAIASAADSRKRRGSKGKQRVPASAPSVPDPDLDPAWGPSPQNPAPPIRSAPSSRSQSPLTSPPHSSRQHSRAGSPADDPVLVRPSDLDAVVNEAVSRALAAQIPPTALPSQLRLPDSLGLPGLIPGKSHTVPCTPPTRRCTPSPAFIRVRCLCPGYLHHSCPLRPRTLLPSAHP